MHIPDGFLSPRIWVSFNVLSSAGVVYAARRIRVQASARVIPIMGTLSAFVFATQLLNFPVLGGTSGHLVGGALLGCLLGPLPGFLTMTTVIVAQALFLQDGGLAALGANVFNIGAVTTFSGHATFSALRGSDGGQRRLGIAGFVAGWISLMLSAVSCALQLGLSGAIPLRVALAAMAGYHSIIGLAEGVLTAGVLTFLAKQRPDLLRGGTSAPFGLRDWVAVTAFVAFPCLILVLAGSSSLPDPLQSLLESSAQDRPRQIARALESPERFTEFLWAGAWILLLVILSYWMARRSQSKKGGS